MNDMTVGNRTLYTLHYTALTYIQSDFAPRRDRVTGRTLEPDLPAFSRIRKPNGIRPQYNNLIVFCFFFPCEYQMATEIT